MKRICSGILCLMLMLSLAACGGPSYAPLTEGAVEIHLSDEGIQVDGATVSTDPSAAVYTAKDIVYYEAGKDFTYGEGTDKDAHTQEEAAAHTVVHIAKAGTYLLSGRLSRGQIAVDLGDDAEEDPDAVVTLILGGVDITCQVAPAVIFYNVYECGDTDAEKASKEVDTSVAGARVVIADGTENTISGAYVERIYKPDTVVLNEDKTQVEEAKKLHKYDGAFYSKRSMTVDGGEKNDGKLTIHASNEGLDSELHLTINGGNITIFSGNDGINTNEDGVSVTAINGGTLRIKVTGETGEGDGIDSNGWLVINGGTVIAEACSHSGDAGIDSDMGIHINGGEVIATGHMLDRIENGGQTYAVFQFAEEQKGGATVTMKDEKGKAVMGYAPENAYSILVYSGSDLAAGTYSLWRDDKQLVGQSGSEAGGGARPPMFSEGDASAQPPEGVAPPDGSVPQDRPEKPDGEMPPEGLTPPEGTEAPERPDGQSGPMHGDFEGDQPAQEAAEKFVIAEGANMFSGVTMAE